MDLAKDVLRLAEKVAHIPGLSAACALAFQILEIVQLSRQNSHRLRYLAHFIADHLVTISDNMSRGWDNAPHTLKGYIDEYEAILRDVLKSVKKYSASSRVLSLINAGDRDMDITRIEKRLSDAQMSTLLVLGVNTSLAVNNLQTDHEHHKHAWIKTSSDICNIQKLMEPHGREVSKFAIGGHSLAPDERTLLYTRKDVKLVQKISRRSHHKMLYGVNSTVGLYHAEQCTDGRLVLVKVYESSSGSLNQEIMSEDLICRETAWDPSVLQLIGASEPSSGAPFQVYHAPVGYTMQTFGNWYHHTLSLSPIETIRGLYDMRTSIKALDEFQLRQRVSFISFIFWDSVVSVQPQGDGVHWSVVYTGELRKPWGDRWTAADPADAYRHLPPIQHVLGDDGISLLTSAFCDACTTWFEDPRPFENVVKCGMEVMSLTRLSSILFEAGWLGECSQFVRTLDNIGLGDVGYIRKDGRFVIVTNLHADLKTTDGAIPTWESKRFWNLGCPSRNIACIDYLNRYHTRYEVQNTKLHWWRKFTIGYNDVDQRGAWGTLQHRGSEIIARNGLSISPHELKLVFRVEKNMTVSYEQCRDSMDLPIQRLAGKGTYSTSILSDPNEGSSGHMSQAPTCYIFEGGEGTPVRESGAPEISARLDASFEEEPVWLHGVNSAGNGGQSQTQDGFELKRTETCWISYLQLPVSVALPYIKEVTLNEEAQLEKHEQFITRGRAAQGFP